MRDCKLPYETYKRAIWTIKDYPRRKEEYNAILIASPPPPDGMPRGNQTGDSTASKAARLAEISNELRAVENALLVVPEEYRAAIWEFVIFKTPLPSTAHVNTYKLWKRRYVYQVAVLLDLI